MTDKNVTEFNLEAYLRQQEANKLIKGRRDAIKAGQRTFHDTEAEIDPIVTPKEAGQANSSSGFAKGAVFSAEIPKPKR